MLAYLTVFRLFVEDQWVAILLAASAGSVLAAVPVVGLVVTSVGVGAVVRNYRA